MIIARFVKAIFLCSSQKETLDAKSILSEVLSTEEELRNFCFSNKLATKNDHLFTFVIEAFLFLMRKTNHAPIDNTTSPAGLLSIANRKRGLPTELDDRTAQPAQRIVRKNIEIVSAQPAQIVSRVSPGKLPIPPTPPQLLSASSMLSSSPSRISKSQKSDEPDLTADGQKETVEFFIESLEKDDSINEPEVKTELADDTMEVIDFNSDPETEQLLPMQPDSGTNVVSLQQPHSSNGSFADGSQVLSVNPKQLSPRPTNIHLSSQVALVEGGVSNRGRSNVLSHFQRLEIISLFENQKLTKAQLGRMYGVTEGAIRKTIRKKDLILQKSLPSPF